MTSRSLTESLRETLAIFDGSEIPRTTTEVADRLDLGRRSTYERLERLVDHGELETKKVGASGRVWWRPRAAADRDGDAGAGKGVTASLIDDVLDDAEVAVFVLDEAFKVAWLNETTERYFGLEREQVLGRDKPTLVRERIASLIDDGDRFADAVLATYEENAHAERFECRVTEGEGREERWLEHRSEPIESGAYAGGRIELYYDVTEQRHTERMRRENRTKFESLVDAVEEDAIFMLDAAGHVRSWNAGAEQIKGYAPEDVLGEHVSVFYTDEDRRAGVPESSLREAAETGSTESEGWRVRADGSRFWASVTITAIRDDDGDLEGYAKVIRDMTDQRERERELRREHALLERILEISPTGIGVFDTDGQSRRVNRHFTEYLGLGGDDSETYVLGDRPLLDEDGEVVPYPERPAPRALATGETVIDQRVRVDAPDEGTRWLSVNATPLSDETGVVVAMADVTRLEEQSRRLERQRDDLESELEEVFDRVDDAFYAVDDEFRFTYVNDRAEDLLGRDEADLLGQIVWEALPVPDDDPIRERFETAMATQTAMSFERFSEPLGIWETVRLYPSESGLSVYFTDMTERKERERELEEIQRRYRALVENFPNGAVALVDEDLRYITFGGTPEGNADMTRSDLEGEHLHDALPDQIAEVVIPPYEAALDGDAAEFEDTIDGRTYQFQFFPVRDDSGDAFAAMAMSQEITEQKQRERELERQREQLAALNNLNNVVQRITEAVVDQSTREEIERVVCDHLADSDSYLFAWIGDVDVASQTVDLQVEAGVEGYLDEVTISVDPDDERSMGLTGRAVQNREIQTSQDIETDSRYDPWRDHIEQYGFRSSAAIPIAHQGTVYGVLNVYAERPNAFEGQERTVIGQLGEVVGHAIAAAERKRALMSDEVVELEFRIRDLFETLGIDLETDGTISLDHTVPIEDDEYLVYGATTEDAVESVEALVDAIPHWVDVTFRSDSGRRHFELRLSEPPVLSAVASLGGAIETAAIEDGDYRMTIHQAPGGDIRRVIDTVQTAYPTAELLKHRQITRRDETAEQVRDVLSGALTDRQRATLEAAFHAGFFEWPRDASGEDVADSLDIAPATFHQHLRRAQKKVFESLLAAPST
ncbi:PAS domain-containing protein [Natrinema marinum]|uniref:PAS domain-containing protein n=1 Tax=Natrinema marinum TaxID=2961598 RepID=UPI0020C87E97|nr:PAS domain-containing protein [Natrinema marinum]